jgi:DNA-binding protein HU-beta
VRAKFWLQKAFKAFFCIKMRNNTEKSTFLFDILKKSPEYKWRKVKNLDNLKSKERILIMNKTEYVDAVAAAAGITKAEASKVVAATIAVITKALKKGESVQITGFGSFDIVKRAARKGRNPATGKEIKIAASKAPRFKAGKLLKDAVK